MSLQLILPQEKYKESFLQAVKEYHDENNKDSLRYANVDIDEVTKDFGTFIKQEIAKSKGKNLPEGYVPETVYWLVEDSEFIGRVSIRHELNELLLKDGGHIGYDIRPSKRRMGYGKKILELALPKATELGIQKVLVTCNETNIGSRKIIEENGGVLENILDLHPGKPRKMRYWIKLD